MKSIQIGNKTIGKGHPVFIVAELSANHNQDYQKAVELIQAAHKAGADAVKLQTYTADTLTIDSQEPYFKIGEGTLWSGKNLYQLYQEAQTPWEWQPKLMKVAQDLGMIFFSTPFDASSVDFLEGLNVPAHKIASFELVDIPLIKKVAQTKKPMILSTGMASVEEIQLAIDTIKAQGNEQIILLKCTSAYPAKPEEMNLLGIEFLSQHFKVPAGLSDHTMGLVAPVVATTLGMVLIEKHLTLSRSDKGPDSEFSLEPNEFTQMVQAIREAEKTLGQAELQVTPGQKPSLMFRKSIFVTNDIKKGETLSAANIRCIRPGHGLEPKHYEAILGKKAKVDIKRGTPLAWNLID